MLYEYSGFLKTRLAEPGEAARDSLDHIRFGVEDLASWSTADLPAEKEWQKVSAQRIREEEALRLVGNFEAVRRIDNLGADDVRFWAPLTTIGWDDPRLPIDTEQYPIVELTYRCSSENGIPAFGWVYPGGLSVKRLPVSPRWRTVAMCVPVCGFPEEVEDILLRLYSGTRTSESVEVREVRFRAMSQAEEACIGELRTACEASPPKRYPALAKFLPLGIVMDARVSRRLAEMLGISLAEYWELAFDDIVAHHHNCVAIEGIENLAIPEWRELLSYAERYHIRLVASPEPPREESVEHMQRVIADRVAPHADSDTLLAWSLHNQAREEDYNNLLRAKEMFEEADPNHPTAVSTHYPTAYPLLSQRFTVSGFSFHQSHAPWEFGKAMGTHVNLASGQQFWVTAPVFTYGSGAPEWPTCPELRLMIGLAFANGVRGWFSYAFHNDPVWAGGACQRTLTGPFLAFSDLWCELDRYMTLYNALAPLLLGARSDGLPEQWYVKSQSAVDMAQLPDGVSPTSSYRLNGPDYSLFFVVSNDIRGMSSLNISIPRAALRGQDIVVLSDFVQMRTWATMDLERHLEMFPGQAHVVLLAQPEVTAHWREVIAQRLIEDDRRQLGLDLGLAHTYGINTKRIERTINRAREDDPVKGLPRMDRARAQLTNLLYDCHDLTASRSAVIRAGSALCACDGALCRLVNKGKNDTAKELGLHVVPLAREMTKLRIEIHHGHGREVLEHAEKLEKKSLELLAKIRASL